MHCCAGNREGKQVPLLAFSVAPLEIPFIDNTFADIRKNIEELIASKQQLENNFHNAVTITDTVTLNNEKSRFAQAVRVLFWSISAVFKGNIYEANPRIQNTSPYLEVPSFDGSERPGDCPAETAELYNSVVHFIRNADNFYEKFLEIKKMIQKVKFDQKQETSEFNKAFNKTLETCEGKQKQELKDALAKAVTKLDDLIEQLVQLSPYLGELARTGAAVKWDLANFLKDANVVGRQAAKEQPPILKPKELFRKYHEDKPQVKPTN
jgi:hypothetical protein